MRPIKYRGQRTDTKGFVYGYVFETPLTSENFKPQYFGQTNPRMCIADKDGVVFTVIPETVGQFTGLTDKNGKDIYEGDIMRNTMFGDLWEVMFADSCYIVSKVSQEYTELLYNVVGFGGSAFDIIGNRYDNPDMLLKSTAND